MSKDLELPGYFSLFSFKFHTSVNPIVDAIVIGFSNHEFSASFYFFNENRTKVFIHLSLLETTENLSKPSTSLPMYITRLDYICVICLQNTYSHLYFKKKKKTKSPWFLYAVLCKHLGSSLSETFLRHGCRTKFGCSGSSCISACETGCFIFARANQ